MRETQKVDKQAERRKSTGKSSRRAFSEAAWASPWTSVALFLLAVSLRLMHVAAMDRYLDFHHPVLDARYFDLWARRLAAGDWLGHDVFFVDPLYAYFLGFLSL